MSTRPATISRTRLPLLIVAASFFGVTACNQVDSGKDAPTGQEVHEIPETKAEEDSRIKRGFHWLLSTPEGNDESIAEIKVQDADADTTGLLHLQENTVAVQVVPFDITQTQEAEEKIAFGPRVTAASVGLIGTVVSDGANGFDELSQPLQKKFKYAGTNGRVSPRTVTEAKQLYRLSIPRIIRDMEEKGVREKAVWEFLGCQGGIECTTDGKHWSHIISYENDPSKVKDPYNGVWEYGENGNWSRHGKNMTRKEVFLAELVNTKDGAKPIKEFPLNAANWGKYARLGGGLGMVAEAPVATAENVFYLRYGQKSLGQAIEDIAIKTAIGTGIGIVSHVGFVVLSPVIGPSVMIPLAIVGGVVYIGTTVYRIAHAANPDLNSGAFLSRLHNTILQKLPLLPRKHNVPTP